MRNLIKHIIVISIGLSILSCRTTKSNDQNESTPTNNNYFEGQITYQLKYKPKTENLTIEQIQDFFGDEQVYIIKEDKYKSTMNGKLKMSQIYLGTDTIFTTTAQTNELLWIDATKSNDEIISTEIIKNAEIVNGYNCDLLIITSKKGKFKYFYNSSFRINEQYYKNHVVGFWDICTDKTNSIMLKSILDTESERIEITAIDIQQKSVEELEFTLPNYKRKRFPIKYKNQP